MWDQTQGDRGSCEIASSVNFFWKTLSPTMDRVEFYSDRWGSKPQPIHCYDVHDCCAAIQKYVL